MTQKYGIPFPDLPAHCLDAADAAESVRARTLVMRNGRPIAAIVPMADLDRIDPPDPGAGGADPLLALCGACSHDDFVNGLVADFTKSGLWQKGFDGAPPSEPPPAQPQPKVILMGEAPPLPPRALATAETPTPPQAPPPPRPPPRRGG